jgi:hypothetical protein
LNFEDVYSYTTGCSKNQSKAAVADEIAGLDRARLRLPPSRPRHWTARPFPDGIPSGSGGRLEGGGFCGGTIKVATRRGGLVAGRGFSPRLA